MKNSDTCINIKMIKMNYMQRNLEAVPFYTNTTDYRLKYKPSCQAPLHDTTYEALVQEAMERSQLQSVQVLLGHIGQHGTALGRQHVSSERDHAFQRRGRGHAHCQESPGKK